MSLLVMAYSPDGDVLTAPRGRVTALAISYEPPTRPLRKAPASVRSAVLTEQVVADCAALIDQLPERGSGR